MVEQVQVEQQGRPQTELAQRQQQQQQERGAQEPREPVLHPQRLRALLQLLEPEVLRKSGLQASTMISKDTSRIKAGRIRLRWLTLIARLRSFMAFLRSSL